jgi:YbbR domain-containing protein
VIVALMLWFVSSEDVNPISNLDRFPMGEPLPIEFRDAPEGRAHYDPSHRDVRLELRGLESGLDQMEGHDIIPYVDLGSVSNEAVTATLALQYDCATCLRRGVRVTGSDVEEIDLRLGSAAKQTRTVTVEPSEPPASGFVVTSANTDPGQVDLAGAATQLARVQRVVAEVGSLAGVRENVDFEAVPVVPVDADGAQVLDVSVSPESVDVDILVQRRGIEVSVSPGPEGVQADGYYISGISVDPQLVQITGDQMQLEELDLLGTLPAAVDISGATDDVVRVVPLPLPDGVRALNAPDGVTVTIQITPLPGTRTLTVPVRARGVDPELQVESISPESIEVLIGGPQATIGDLEPDDVVLTVNLTGLGAGSHTVSLTQPRVPSGYFVRSVNPSVVVVELARRDGAPDRAVP